MDPSKFGLLAKKKKEAMLLAIEARNNMRIFKSNT